MQLLSPVGGEMGISIEANGANYIYNYDPDGSWKADHYLQITTDEDKWSAADTCDPLQDLEDALDAQEAAGGNRPEIVLMNKTTFNYIKNAQKVRDSIISQNLIATANITTARVKSFIEEELNVTIVIYNKQYKTEDGTAQQFYPDNMVMLLPEGALGSTWYGTTLEERTLMASNTANVSIVNTGVAVAVTVTEDPVNTKTTVSEIVLPSFERMEECYAMEVA